VLKPKPEMEEMEEIQKMMVIMEKKVKLKSKKFGQIILPRTREN